MYKHKAFSYRARRKRAIRPAALIAALMAGIVIGFGLSPRQTEARAPEYPLLALSPELTPEPTGAAPSPAAEDEPVTAPRDASMPEVRLASSAITVCVHGEPAAMELEDYLVGVVAAEMSASSEPAALEAQAVAARTFTALHMEGRAKCRSGCTVCSDPHCCQAYMTDAELHAFWGDRYDANIEKIRAAVGSTRSLAATYGGKLISALYHASSGPATESSAEVFAVAQPYLVSVDSCEGEKETVSVQEFSAEEAAAKLNEAFPQAGLTVPLSPKDFEVWGRTRSGRVQLISIGGAVISGVQMRAVLGLRSTAFSVEHDGFTLRFTCTGYGHGVGMSQLGANEMARAGSTFEEILKHFYTGTELALLTYGE
ncbi:MAG: stage II sporulation protein D [Clostridia bacterium]|nr:stage II sporulation protein D [Clostridia bacterium]